MKRIGFLSLGHWSDAPYSQVRSASDALLQSIELAVAAEELGADGAYFRVHHCQRLDNRPVRRTLQGMKTIGVTDLRQRTAQILEDLQQTDEPVAILQRSRPTAYLVSATQFEAERAELRATRRALFLREVREAEIEYRAGDATSFTSVDELLDDLRG